MLDLHSGIDLQEGDGAVLRNDEFYRARGGVVAGLAHCACTFDDAATLLVGEEWSRSFLDKFLEATLRGAITRAHHNHVPVRIREHLGFDVAWFGQEFFHVTFGAPERFLGFAASGQEGVLNIVDVVDYLQATATAAKRCLDGNGHAVFPREGAGFLPVIDRFRGAWRKWRAHLGGQCAGSDFVAEQFDGFGAGANPGQAGVLDCAGKVRVFGEEAVSGVDAIGTRAGCDIQQGRNVHVGFCAGGAREGVGFVGNQGVEGTGVGLRVDGNRTDSQVAGGPGDAHGDFTTVGNKYCV